MFNEGHPYFIWRILGLVSLGLSGTVSVAMVSVVPFLELDRLLSGIWKYPSGRNQGPETLFVDCLGYRFNVKTTRDGILKPVLN